MLSYKVTPEKQIVELQLKVDEHLVDTITIDVSNWAPEHKDIVLELANTAVVMALFDQDIVVTKDDETPLLF